MGYLAERDVKQKEGRHEEEYPHPGRFGSTLDPQPHSYGAYPEECGHKDDREIIINRADYLDFRYGNSSVNST